MGDTFRIYTDTPGHHTRFATGRLELATGSRQRALRAVSRLLDAGYPQDSIYVLHANRYAPARAHLLLPSQQ